MTCTGTGARAAGGARATFVVILASFALFAGASMAVVACSSSSSSGSSSGSVGDGGGGDASKDGASSNTPLNAGTNLVTCGSATCDLTQDQVCCNYFYLNDVQFKCVAKAAGCDSERPPSPNPDAGVEYVSHVVGCDDPTDCSAANGGGPGAECCLSTIDSLCSDTRIGDALCVPPGTCACKPGVANTIGFVACASSGDCDGGACTDPSSPTYPWSYCAAQ